jgi:type II secretory pathway component GspD/PulD (secretin)
MNMQCRGPRLLQGLLAAVAMLCGPLAHAEALEAITLQHRLAEDLVPILQPLLPAGAGLSGAGNVLLVRADEVTMEQVRRAIAALDRAPRQLLITVGQDTDAAERSAAVRGSGTVATGDVQVGVNQPPQGQSGAQVVLRGSADQGRIRSVSSVRAVDGYEAYVAVGQSRPFTSRSVVTVPYGGRVVEQTTGYRDVQTGFYATPRLSGDRVTLEISPTQQQATPGQRDAVSTRSLTTTVSGRLGEWIAIGGATESRDDGTVGLATWGQRTQLTQYSAWVKVEEVP